MSTAVYSSRASSMNALVLPSAPQQLRSIPARKIRPTMISARLRESLFQASNTTTLIGAGANVDCVLDVLRWRKLNAPRSEIKVLLSMQELDFFTAVQKMIEPFAAGDPSVRVYLALTNNHLGIRETATPVNLLTAKRAMFDFDVAYESDSDSETEEIDESWSANRVEQSIPNVWVQYAPFDFRHEIEAEATVFSQGSQAFHEHVEGICRARNVPFFGGRKSTVAASVPTRRISNAALPKSLQRRSFRNYTKNSFKGLRSSLSFGSSSQHNNHRASSKESLLLKGNRKSMLF